MPYPSPFEEEAKKQGVTVRELFLRELTELKHVSKLAAKYGWSYDKTWRRAQDENLVSEMVWTVKEGESA